MMATAGPPSSSSFLPLLESVEDSAAGQSEQTDAYLTIANRLSGEEGRQLLPAVEKHFSRFGKATLAHITSPNPELSQAALQALGFCVYHSHVVSGVPETLAAEILTTLCSLVVKATDKNTCTRALWVISKQSFPPDVVAKKVPSILGSLEGVWSREDIQSVVMEHEALNVVIRMLEQVPTLMGDGVVRWAKLIIPLVVHSASKVRLRAAAAMEMGMPLLLQKQTEVAAIIEPMMSTKLIPELQKLFMSKNETNVLKLWPLFVKLLGKLLHRGGPFINSLLHLEELGFRSSSPTIKKIAFIAWKSLIDNFALNPDILCSSKRMKLLMQPLASIHVRTEALLLTKVEVWWYLVVQLGPNLSANFDQVSVPLLLCVIGSDSTTVPGTPSRSVSQNTSVPPGTPKTVGTPGFNSPANSSRMSLNSSVQYPSTFPSVQLLGLEMLMHYFLGPEVIATAAKNKIILSLEPLKHPLLSGASSFSKYAAVLISSIKDGFINIGKEAPDSLLAVLWTNLVRFVNLSIESAGSKKDRQGCEVLTLMLQALQSIVSSEALPADKVLILFEATVKGIPQKVLGSASYQVGKMDVLNGTPALFLIQLLYSSSTLPAFIDDERFFHCLQTLVGCGLSGHTSPLAFGEAVLSAIGRSAAPLQNKEQLWRMWSVMVSPLIETITQSNEVNQGDALEHNFSAMHSALMFPITHLLPGAPLQQASQKSMLSMWARLYKVFARCSALVVTAEENICCEELCAKMTTAIDGDALKVHSTLNAVSSILQVMVECVDFSPFTPQFQQKLKSPHTPVNWMKKRNKVLGNLTTFQSLLVQCLDVYLKDSEAPSENTGLALFSILSTLFSNLALANTVTAALTALIPTMTLIYKQAAIEPPRFTSQLQGKLEKLLSDVLGCLQTRSTLAYDNELLALLSPLLCVLFPHKNKQLRSAVTQFWNSTFGNSVSLTYPDEIRPILSQVKQKTPIILPGFEVHVVPDELSEHYSSESSQMETKLSGMLVSSVGKRDSLLGKTPETKERNSIKTSKPVSTKLDFGSPKPPRRGVLEEEASIDFVFIPPETKERVLTEHQKEVKRTKRVDIPAMYNNLDASLDTTVFSQYTQSQEDSLDKLPAEQTKEAPVKVPQTDAQIEEDAEVLTKSTQDDDSPKAAETENQKQEEMIPESTDVSMEDVSKSDDKELETKQGTSPNMSGSSDLVSGTPQKPNSRRQSFITLEKYAEGKPSSPASVSKFTGPLTKTSNSQERSDTKTSSQASSTSISPDSQDSQTGEMDTMDSPVRPKDSGAKCEPVRLTDRLSSDTTEDEDVIPDTQTKAEAKKSTKVDPTSQDNEPSSQEEEPDSQTLDDTRSSESPGEPRRSGRHRVRPLLPGEDPEERDQKYMQLKRKRSEGGSKGDSPKSNQAQSKPNTRSKNTVEEESKLRTRAQRESSQTNSQGRGHKKMRLYSSSLDFLDQPEPRRRSTRDRESSQTELKSDSQTDSQSQGQGRRRSRSSLETKEDAGGKKKASESSQTDSQSNQGSQSQGKISRRSRSALEAQEEAVIINTDLPDKETMTPGPEQPKNNLEEPTNDSTILTSSLKTSKSQEFDLEEQTERDRGSQTTLPPQDSQDLTKPTSDLVKEVTDEMGENTNNNLNQEDSQAPSSDSQSLHKSRISKESSDSSQFKDYEGVETNKEEENSQSTLNKPEVKDETKEGADIKLSQEGEMTPSSDDSRSLRKSRRSKALSDSQTDAQSQESQSVKKSRKGRRGSQIDASLSANESQEEVGTVEKLGSQAHVNEDETKDSTHDQLSQEDSQRITPSSSESQSLRKSRRSKSSSDSQIDGHSQESQNVKKTQKDSPVVSSSPAPDSQEETSSSQLLRSESDVGGETKDVLDDQLSQEDSQVNTPSLSESQSLRKSRRSKTSETAEEKGKDKESSRRQSRSSSQLTQDAVEAKPGGRTRRSMVKEDQTKSLSQGSQSLDGSVESSQGRGRYSRRSSQALVAKTSGSESPEAKESPKKRGKKARVSLPSPLTLESQDVDMDHSQDSQREASQSVDTQTLPQEEEPTEEPEQVTSYTEEQQHQESQMEVEDEVKKTETETKTSETLTTSPQKDSETNAEKTRDLESAEEPELPKITAEQTQEETPCDSAPLDKQAPLDEATEHLQVSEPPEEKMEKDQNQDSDSNKQEHPVVPEEDLTEKSQDASPDQSDCSDVTDDNPKEEEQPSADDVTPLQGSDTDTKPQDVEGAQTNSENDSNMDPAPADTCIMSALSEMTRNLENAEKLQGSPVKQKDLEAVMGQDVGQSPSGGRTRGSWSPSASPSTSILKKGQKRALEDETPSPLVKSRRVSFANPIQHQETADDIDRRSPALRTSSPRRSKVSSIPQPKFITTPTKGMLMLSPRNLHSPGYKSSKKCLISEMSQEPRPVSRDCIYPALVGCSTPVEAVLPQISSNMWSRGFGQLVRARNIKTVGDLSALTPSEIKTLPIRSPKISNVKKALKIYEQQRKGRGGDELKSFDETEMMTSELDETSAPQNQDEEDKVSGETLATELVDEPVLPEETKPENDLSRYHTPDTSPGERRAEGQQQTAAEGLFSDMEALTCRMTPLELGQCSAQQLVQIHDQLGGMMRHVVIELQTRLCQTDGKP